MTYSLNKPKKLPASNSNAMIYIFAFSFLTYKATLKKETSFQLTCFSPTYICTLLLESEKLNLPYIRKITLKFISCIIHMLLDCLRHIIFSNNNFSCTRQFHSISAYKRPHDVSASEITYTN